ncbi:hypothetical protein WBJ53_00800 [Spirosoma sp. SC4-14]|uniref:hypothetical protein n=1 Tax=Spirosoma sp. SC4-14 TaxID=3128900 RepID=UPI0030D0B51B
MRNRILLIGRNPIILSDLAEALTQEGLWVQTTSLVDEAIETINGQDFDLIALGRGIDELTNQRLKSHFLSQNKELLFVDGLVPIIPLLVKQITVALATARGLNENLTCFGYDSCEGIVLVAVDAVCQLAVDLYQLDASYSTHQYTLISERVNPGEYTFSVPPQQIDCTRINLLAAEVNQNELAIIEL